MNDPVLSNHFPVKNKWPYYVSYYRCPTVWFFHSSLIHVYTASIKKYLICLLIFLCHLELNNHTFYYYDQRCYKINIFIEIITLVDETLLFFLYPFVIYWYLYWYFACLPLMFGRCYNLLALENDSLSSKSWMVNTLCPPSTSI